MRILYVDDQRSVLTFVRALFSEINIDNVTFLTNAQEALQLYKSQPYELVITDMYMPDMDGFELISEIRKINPRQVFMMVTGMDNKEDLIKAIELRVNFFLQKPIQIDKFKASMHEAINLVNRRKEFELATSLLEQYKYLVDETAIITKTDTKGIITYANDEFCKISGYERDEVVGKSQNIVRHSEMSGEIFKELWETIQSKKTWKGIISNKAKDGSTYIVEAFVMPLLDAQNNIIEYISIRHDITELELYKKDLQGQLAIAVKDIEDTQKEVVFTMGAIGETRSKETGLHVKRVAEYSYTLARLAGVQEKEADVLRLASPMHDIGKVGIPDDILNKPGKLTDNEFAIMKTHAQLGYDMLKHSNKEILKASATIAHEHHERWDGNGYPRGIKGDEIHLYGRITAVCDVFDALSHDRVYKKAWPLEKILELFREGKGTQFDPRLIDLFINNLDTFLEIRDKYNDAYCFLE